MRPTPEMNRSVQNTHARAHVHTHAHMHTYANRLRQEEDKLVSDAKRPGVCFQQPRFSPQHQGHSKMRARTHVCLHVITTRVNRKGGDAIAKPLAKLVVPVFHKTAGAYNDGLADSWSAVRALCLIRAHKSSN